jgi:YD repeat-containing protein
MKKHYLILSLLFCATISFAQNPEIKTDLPTIIPPSPTVAALMKFEEVPVSNYTGIPDISIPLFSSPTHSKDITLDISLKYHPSAVAPRERASDVGLGWSLFAGGSISRTVRGMPDEVAFGGSNPKVGIYKDSISTYLKNNYYEALPAFEAIANDTLGLGLQYEITEKFLWDTKARGAYDAEHDLWQFNFMGKSGRFYIKKNNQNQLEVIPLDDYKIKIINNYVTSGSVFDIYKPTGFVIYDEKGYKYIFDIVENTKAFTISFNDPIPFLGIPDTYYQDSTFYYNSAFHLSKVLDNNNELIIDFSYNSNKIVEKVIDGAETRYVEDYMLNGTSMYDLVNSFTCHRQVKNFAPYPLMSITPTQKSTIVRKLSQIKVVGIAKIDFVYTQGREDDYFIDNDSSYVFNGIVVKDWQNNRIKEVTLDKTYKTALKKRLFLEKVRIKNFQNSDEFVYNLAYRDCTVGINPDVVLNTDLWGYLDVLPMTYPDVIYRNANPDFTTHETLQKMTLPTGGSTIFDFEANKYSYIGGTALTNFDANPDNWDVVEEQAVFTNFSPNTPPTTSSTIDFFTITETQDLPIIIMIEYPTSSTDSIQAWRVDLYKKVGTTFTLVKTITGDYTLTSLAGTMLSIEPGDYWVTFKPFGYSPGVITFTATITTYPKTRNNKERKFIYGGGNRIKKIGYFKNTDVVQNIYQNLPLTTIPNKEMNFDYNFFNDIIRSSGSLAFGVPRYSYKKSKKECTYCETAFPMLIPYNKNDTSVYHYDVVTSFNNIQPIKTQGADVGYQNVKVFEKDNGYTEFIYSSPIDYHETISEENLSPPFLPTENYDYKRGLLRFEKIYNEQHKKLKATELDYDFENHIEVTGIKTFYKQYDFINIYNHKLYSEYDTYIRTCSEYELPAPPSECFPYFLTDSYSCDCFCYFGKPTEFTGFRLIKEAYGWVKLTSKKTLNYFYPNGSTTPNIVETNEAYTYNPINKKIASQSVINSKGETLLTNFTYDTGNSPNTENRISEIKKVETLKNGVPLSSSDIKYDSSWSNNTAILPKTIRTSKGVQGLEDRVQYNAYDMYSNPLEVQQENGTKVCYIWGYHKTQPVAKIENIDYAVIPSNLISEIEDKSNLVNNNNPTNLINTLNELQIKLDNLRNNSALANAMITTYTYIPLVGVSTITDPKGQVTTYVYDAFNRLKEVKDDHGNILSENEYHYKP